jgi:leucyl aminopeptidase
MEIRATDSNIQVWSGDTLALGIWQEEKELGPNLTALDQRLGGVIQELISESEFEAKPGNCVGTRVGKDSPIRKLILVGLGEAENFSLQTLRNASAAIARVAKQQKTHHLAVSLPTTEDAQASSQAIAEGFILSLHQDTRFKSEPDTGLKLETLEILGGNALGITEAEQICQGVILARELVNAPANSVTALTLADTARQIAADYGLTLEILEAEDCEKLGMGAFLGVAQASDLPPKFIHLIYKPPGTPSKKIAIVGKSLTFDSGGLNIKGTGSGIETMKMDMGGGAATLGAALAVGQLRPSAEVHFICAATENMISGHAMHPGDILTASNGKTIEVNNTDAEGRLTLADALVFAEKLDVEAIVDLATLTGACIIALGDDIAGLWSTDSALAAQVKQAAELAGEKFWEMPLEEKYFEGLKSPIADMKNTGPRAGGSITAALFLKQFVQKTPWVHLDIAGPVWAEKENGIHNVGATGFPVRTLVNWIRA